MVPLLDTQSMKREKGLRSKESLLIRTVSV